MKPGVAISFALVAFSVLAAAQSANQYHPQKFDPQAVQSHAITSLDLASSRATSSCPAQFSARQGGMGDLVAAGPGKTPETGLSQRIYLTSAGTSGNHAVVSASVAVHGLTPQSRVVPVQSGDERAQASRKLKVSFSSDASGAAGADLAVRGFSAVLSIDVDSVTFADGSTWKSAAGACRVIPDPVMLIGSF